MKKENIEVVKWEIRVDEDKNPQAEVVGLDKNGNEYRLSYSVYVHGEYHDFSPQIICTKNSNPPTSL